MLCCAVLDAPCLPQSGAPKTSGAGAGGETERLRSKSGVRFGSGGGADEQEDDPDDDQDDDAPVGTKSGKVGSGGLIGVIAVSCGSQ
jgi:hypothetical protein